jgi:hypothetical protein
MIDRRLDSQERAAIQVGNIYVWEERGALDISGMGIERWYALIQERSQSLKSSRTDGIRWGPSRLRNVCIKCIVSDSLTNEILQDFLFYQQREEPSRDRHAIGLTPKR